MDNTKHKRALWWTLGSLLFLASVGLILAAYRFGWTATGFQGKTVWDWLQLLIIPLVLALVAIVFNQMNTRTERQITQQRYERDQQITQQRYERDQQITQQHYEHDQELALDKQREDLLQAYLDRMSELLLEKGLRTSKAGSEIRNIARVRTINILIQLDAKRIEYVFAFLREANLTEANLSLPTVYLGQANLSHVNWSNINLSNISLKEANLSHANLSHADLSETNLSLVNLSYTDLSHANLIGADLSSAWLRGANLNGAKFSGVHHIEISSHGEKTEIISRARVDKSWLTPEQIAQIIW